MRYLELTEAEAAWLERTLCAIGDGYVYHGKEARKHAPRIVAKLEDTHRVALAAARPAPEGAATPAATP